MKRTLLASAATLAIALPAVAARAEAAPPELFLHYDLLASADEARTQGEAWRTWAQDFSRDMAESMSTMFAGRVGSGKVVKGAPYSAQMVTETNQALADGNVISRKKTAHVYRDNEGRTRQETGAAGKEPTVYINDPVEGKNIVLLPGTRRAIVTPSALSKGLVKDHKEKRVVQVAGTEVRVEDGKVFVDGKEVAGGKVELKAGGKEIKVENGRVSIDGKEVGHAAHAPKVIVRSIDEQETGDGTRREEVRVQVIRAGDMKLLAPLAPMPPVPPTPMAAPGAPMPPMPGAHTFRFDHSAKLGKGVTTSLGTKDFDGVKAEGKSTVWTIPAGEIGNRNPIQVTSEAWYSPELQVTVYSRYNDPRTGESIYRLAGIRRGEPPAELFQVPAGFESKTRGRARH